MPVGERAEERHITPGARNWCGRPEGRKANGWPPVFHELEDSCLEPRHGTAGQHLQGVHDHRFVTFRLKAGVDLSHGLLGQLTQRLGGSRLLRRLSTPEPLDQQGRGRVEADAAKRETCGGSHRRVGVAKVVDDRRHVGFVERAGRSAPRRTSGSVSSSSAGRRGASASGNRRKRPSIHPALSSDARRASSSGWSDSIPVATTSAAAARTRPSASPPSPVSGGVDRLPRTSR